MVSILSPNLKSLANLIIAYNVHQKSVLNLRNVWETAWSFHISLAFLQVIESMKCCV